MKSRAETKTSAKVEHDIGIRFVLHVSQAGVGVAARGQILLQTSVEASGLHDRHKSTATYRFDRSMFVL